MKLWVSLFSVGVLTAWSPSANALELCAVLDKKTGELKEGSPIKLRSVCKTKKNGTPIEISIGTTEALAAATANTAAREDLEQYLEVDTTNHVVRFTGANVQIRSGAGASWGTGVSATPDVNGLGNLIIGTWPPIPYIRGAGETSANENTNLSTRHRHVSCRCVR